MIPVTDHLPGSRIHFRMRPAVVAHRDLHDSVGQMVVALSMNGKLALAEADKVSALASGALRQNVEITEQLSKEVRTLSHLLHPTVLDEIGLGPAIRMLANGFAERGDVKVAVDVAPDIGRLVPHVEISIFRIVQECLTNVHRHSGSKTVRIKLWATEENLLTVQVVDEGIGIAPNTHMSMSVGTNHGVGLSGMRERVKELGGTLEIQSSERRTTVTAQFPLTKAAAIWA